MLWFVAGMFTGFALGFLVAGLAAAARRGDEQMEEAWRRRSSE